MSSDKQKENRVKPAERRKARQFATQAIYQWLMTKENVANIEHQFLTEQDLSKADVDYFRLLIGGVVGMAAKLDEQMSPCLARRLNELDIVDHSILLLAFYELTQCKDVPPKVVMNEAIELAKSFAAEDSHKFVNGVLDKFYRLQQIKES
jgi:N utilization substance protein B